MDSDKKLDPYGRPYPNYSKHLVPFLTADALVMRPTADGSFQLLLITRGDEPYTGKLAFPGGHIDYNEDPEVGVVRELMEETSLKGLSVELLCVKGAPNRDPRRHTVSIVYIVKVAEDAVPVAGDDAATAKFYSIPDIIANKDGFAFDHWDIITILFDKYKVPY